MFLSTLRRTIAVGVFSCLGAFSASADILLEAATQCVYVNQCADDYDNDGNGLTDLADGKCVTQWDSSEVQFGRQTDFLVCSAFWWEPQISALLGQVNPQTQAANTAHIQLQ